jgi:hypothetical protein
MHGCDDLQIISSLLRRTLPTERLIDTPTPESELAIRKSESSLVAVLRALFWCRGEGCKWEYPLRKPSCNGYPPPCTPPRAPDSDSVWCPKGVVGGRGGGYRLQEGSCNRYTHVSVSVCLCVSNAWRLHQGRVCLEPCRLRPSAGIRHAARDCGE